MPCLYITGGKQKPRQTDEWNQYQEARIVKLNADTGDGEVVVRHHSPAGCYPENEPNFLFKASTIRDDRLYACTGTEVLVYELPGFHLARHISLPCFNDLHHVQPTSTGSVLVVGTGLDMVFDVSLDGETVREWDVLGQPLWHKYSRDVDYRRIATTKPHASHPNFVCEIGGDVWATRYMQQDAVCLTRPDRRVVLGTQPHDGVAWNGYRYFTTVDGRVFIVDETTMDVAETVDLNEIEDADGAPLGWCRGILPQDERYCWIGFSRLRPTRFRENVAWIRHGFRQRSRPTRVTLYDLQAKAKVREFSLEQWGINALFSILPVSAQPPERVR